MTNNDRVTTLANMGYSTREIDETMENETGGSHYANALAFIIDSLSDDSPVSEFGSGYLRNMDNESILEFGAIYNFTPDALTKAIDAFQRAVLIESELN